MQVTLSESCEQIDFSIIADICQKLCFNDIKIN